MIWLFRFFNFISLCDGGRGGIVVRFARGVTGLIEDGNGNDTMISLFLFSQMLSRYSVALVEIVFNLISLAGDTTPGCHSRDHAFRPLWLQVPVIKINFIDGRRPAACTCKYTSLCTH